MFKKIKQIFAIFSLISENLDDLKKLINQFEDAFEDGKLSFEELTSIIVSLIAILRRIFPSLRR